MMASTVVVGGIWVISIMFSPGTDRHRARTLTLPRPVSKMSRIWAASYRICPPPTKSGAGMVEPMSWFGSLSRATVVAHSSARLNEQMLHAMPTAMPSVLLARMVGKVTGSRVGSVVVPS